jgi:hypothetical protein
MREFGIDKASQALDFLLGGCSRCSQFRPCLWRKLRGFYYLKLMIINYCYLKFRDICHLGILVASLLSTGPIRGLLKELNLIYHLSLLSTKFYQLVDFQY